MLYLINSGTGIWMKNIIYIQYLCYFIYVLKHMCGLFIPIHKKCSDGLIFGYLCVYMSPKVNEFNMIHIIIKYQILKRMLY